MFNDEIIVLPSGTELSVEAALGDLARIEELLLDEDYPGEACDAQHIAELLRALSDRTLR